MLWHKKLLKDGALTCSLCKSTGRGCTNPQKARQIRQQPAIRIFFTGEIPVQLPPPLLIPLKMLTGVGQNFASIKSFGHTAVRQDSEPGKKLVVLVLVWGSFFSFFSSCCSCSAHLQSLQRARDYSIHTPLWLLLGPCAAQCQDLSL